MTENFVRNNFQKIPFYVAEISEKSVPIPKAPEINFRGFPYSRRKRQNLAFQLGRAAWGASGASVALQAGALLFRMVSIFSFGIKF